MDARLVVLTLADLPNNGRDFQAKPMRCPTKHLNQSMTSMKQRPQLLR
jgi:hypothetical protein